MARANSAPIDAYLEQLWEHKGSDLLLTAGAPPLVRVDGLLQPLANTEALRPQDLESLISQVLPDDLLERFHSDKEVDFSFNWRSLARFRANAFMQRGSYSLAVRSIPYEIPSFDDLGLPEICERLVNLPHGLILVTGPTGSGKSTTLASMLDAINAKRRCHILTIEDPIEYVHRHKLAAVNQREIGEDTRSFERALRSALREDPDVLLIGEMRDLETIRIALTVAETGHLVFATLHTNDTPQAIDRIVDVFPGEQQGQIRVQLANSLQAVIFQQLLPRIGGGRVAAFEVMTATYALRNLIKEGKTSQMRNLVVTGTKDGMQTFEASLSTLIAEGAIDPQVARMRSMYPAEIKLPYADAPTGPNGTVPSVNPGRSRRGRYSA